MWLIGKLIEIALDQLYECAIIDWWPGSENTLDSFEAVCEIEGSRTLKPYGENLWDMNFFMFFFVFVNGVPSGIFCIIDAEHLECWHASKLEWVSEAEFSA